MNSLKKLISFITIIITLSALFFSVMVHVKIFQRRNSGFILDSNCKIKSVSAKNQGFHRGDLLTGVKQKHLGFIPVKSTFSWIKIVSTLDYGPTSFYLKRGTKTVAVKGVISHANLFPKLFYTLFSGLITFLAIIFLFIRNSQDEKGIFNFLIITLGATYMLALSYTNLDSIASDPFFLISFLLWNVLGPPSLLLFFLRFPYKKTVGRLPWSALMYIPAVLAFGVTSYIYMKFYGNPISSRQDELLFMGRILIPGTNMLYGLGMVAAIFHSLFKAPPTERSRMVLVVYGLFIILLLISSWVFLYSKDSAMSQITSGPDLLMILHTVLAISLYSSTSNMWVKRADTLVNRGVVYGVISIGIVLLYLFISWVLGLFLTQMLGLESKTITILAAVFSTAGLFSLREFVQNQIDKLFFRTRYIYGEVLKETSERFSSIMELPRLFDSILKILGASMKLNSGAVWLLQPKKRDFYFLKSWGKAHEVETIFKYKVIKNIWKNAKQGILLKGDINSENKVANDFFNSLGANCIVFLTFQDKFYGFIALGEKIEGIPFSRDDTDLLVSIGKQAGVAVKNSMAYSTILSLNKDLALSKGEIERLKSRLEIENIYLKKKVMDASRFGDIIGDSEKITEVKNLIQKVAPSDAGILILGESGTGKELIAQTIHNLSSVKSRAIVTVNCAAIPATLIESELFGHEKGAFTGAVRKKVGQFELANNSTIFLDEIGELPLEMQPKLLRALQEGEISPLGNEKKIKVKVRVIAATNQDLLKMISEGKFREDLYYRINVVPINLPPLRERSGDIPLLAQYFLEIHAKRMGKKVVSFSKDAIFRLSNYPWPGNVRELSNVIERGVALSDRETLDDEIMLPVFSKTDKMSSTNNNFTVETDLEADTDDLPYREALDKFKRTYLIGVLKKTGGNKSEAARIVGLQRPYLHKLIKELGIEK